MIGRLYLWLWFHTEFWLTRVDRRPYTFIMRDWIYTHVDLTLTLVILWYADMVLLSIYHGTAATITVSLGSFLLAHLVWGSTWIEHQQELPEYLG